MLCHHVVQSREKSISELPQHVPHVLNVYARASQYSVRDTVTVDFVFARQMGPDLHSLSAPNLTGSRKSQGNRRGFQTTPPAMLSWMTPYEVTLALSSAEIVVVVFPRRR